MDTMTTVSEVLNRLKKDGYNVDFNLSESCLVCQGNSLELYPEDFVVDKHYRFEGISDPADEAIVYAISSDKHRVKGTLVDGYGIYSDSLTHAMLKALQEKPASAAAQENEPVPLEEVKFNEATPQRPQGDRLLNAPLVLLDLPAALLQIKEEQAWETSDRNAITLFKSDAMRMVMIALHPGAEMKTHTAPGTISVQVLQGQIEFTVAEEPHQRSTGQALTLQGGIPHSVTPLEDSVVLLTLVLAK